ncbi:MAG: diguanylate cyclase, partial [Dehalococcoidia bacterium]
WALIPLLSCLSFIILFILVLQQARRRVDKVFAVLLFASGIWSFTSFMLVFNPAASSRYLIFWNGLVIAAIPWVAVAYYHFVRAYNNRPGGIGVYLGYTFVVAILILCLSGYVVKSASLVNGFLHHDIRPWDFILAGILIPFLALIIHMLVQRYRSSIDPTDRNRTLYLITGAGILIAISYVTPFTPALAGLPTDHIGNLLNALIIAYAISRLHLLNINLVVRRGLTYALLAGAFIGICAGAILLGFQLFPEQSIYNIVTVATLIALLLVILTRPIKSILEERIDRLFHRGTYTHRQTLSSFSSRMRNILNLSELASQMLPAITKALNITQARLLFEDINSGDFTTQFIYPKAEGKSSDELRFSVDNPIVAWLAKRSSHLSPEQIGSIPEFKGLWQAEKEQLATANWGLLYPIKSRGRLIGILALGKKHSGSLYSHEDVELVTTIANQAGILIENAQLYTQAMIRANTDGLTGLYNHRHFHERLEQEIARGLRFGTVFSVIFLDIDLFKIYNDVYGHLAGDKALRKIGEQIKNSIRNMDMAFRYGGEEFTIILPEAQLDDAYKVAERIRDTIGSATSSRGMPLTVSLGVANWPSDGVAREEIIGCADDALYQAKQMGRNRTCLSSEATKTGTSLVSDKLEARRGALNIIYALAATVDAKDHYTYGHSKKVSEHTVAMAEALGLPKDRVATIRTAALLHDIGKISVSDSILNKEESLSEDEWGEIKAHPQVGVDILRHVIDLVNCLPSILHHHEHYNGSGYPAGLKGNNIPLEARLLAIADAYDAITSLRPYHERLSPQQALKELRRCAGTQFDPELVEVFCKIMEPIISKELEIK